MTTMAPTPTELALETALETARRELAAARNDLHTMKRAHKALIERHHQETSQLQADLWGYLLDTGTALIATNESRTGPGWRIIDQACAPVHAAATLAGLLHATRSAAGARLAPEPGLRDYRATEGT